MRKKQGILSLLILLVALAGCSEQLNAGYSVETTSGVSDVNEQTTINGDDTQSVVDKNTNAEKERDYYKISFSDAELDYTNIIGYLTNSTWDGSSEGSIDVDGIQHSWTIEDKTFTYGNNREDGAGDESSAKERSDSCIENLNLGVNVNKEPSCVKDENENYTFTYTLEYDGIMIMGNKNVYLPGDSDTPVHGAYIEITIGKSGIQSFFISNLITVGETLETYQSEKLLDETEINSIIENYYQQFEDDNTKENISIDTVSVIYMPYQEGSDKTLIPVFDVNVNRGENGNQEILMDALTGYIYYAG